MLATKEQIIQMEKESKALKNTKIEFGTEVIKGIKAIVKGHKHNKDIPILNYIKLEVVNKNVLKVIYGNMDLVVEKMFVAEIPYIKTKEFVLPISFFTSLKGIKKKDIFTFQEVNDEVMVLTRNNLKQIINIVNVKEFPNFTNKKEKFTYVETVNGNEYFQYDELELLNKAVLSVAKSESRPILQTISIQNGNMVSTDSHRLYRAKTVFKTEKVITINPILVKKAIEICDKNMFLKLSISDNNCKIEDDYSTKIQARIYDGNFPDTSRLMPQDFKYEVQIHQTEKLFEFANNVKGLEKNHLMRFMLDVKKQEIHLEVVTENGKAEIDIPVLINTFDNDLFKIAFSYKYLLDGLKQLDKNQITMKFISDMRPFIIEKQDSEKETVLILPVRTY